MASFREKSEIGIYHTVLSADLVSSEQDLRPESSAV